MSFSDLMESKRLNLLEVEAEQDVNLNMAAAAIMFAVIAADEQVASVEIAHLIELLRKRYGMENEELVEIMSAARRAVNNEGALKGFLFLLRKNLNCQERTQLLDDMWDIACSDSTVRATERLTIDRFADELDLDTKTVTKARDIAKQKLELYLG